jgi:hypothetical protein
MTWHRLSPAPTDVTREAPTSLFTYRPAHVHFTLRMQLSKQASIRKLAFFLSCG